MVTNLSYRLWRQEKAAREESSVQSCCHAEVAGLEGQTARAFICACMMLCASRAERDEPGPLDACDGIPEAGISYNLFALLAMYFLTDLLITRLRQSQA